MRLPINRDCDMVIAMDDEALMNNIVRFTSLFRGNLRSFGVWDPMKPPSQASRTESGAFGTDQVISHLSGGIGLGVVPVMDDGLAYFGAIDIDNHSSKVDIDLAAVNAKIISLPLVACRSKSGGVHLYLFGREPLRATALRNALLKWAKSLGIEGVDCVFPKQTRLAFNDDGTRALGNWINLPYFNASATERYAVNESSSPLSLELFLTLAESKAITQQQLDRFVNADHDEAPPCLATGIESGIESGNRNEFAYQLTVYMRKRFPDDFKDRIYDMNASVFKPALPFSELKKIVTSASRRDYKYKCKTEPCASMCDKRTCLVKRFGVAQQDLDEQEAESKLPILGDLIQYKTNPVRWELEIEGSKMVLTTEQLFDWQAIRYRLAENLKRVFPPMGKGKWHLMLESLMTKCRVEEAPEDASVEGVIKSFLFDFVRRADLEAPGINAEDRLRIMHGVPVLLEVSGVKSIYFRGQDFVAYLKRNKAEELKGPNLWLTLQKMGAKHTRLRCGDKLPTVWYIDLSNEHMLDLAPVQFKEPEF